MALFAQFYSMEKQYTISGMTCSSCVAKVKQSLEELDQVDKAQIILEPPIGTLSMDQDISLSQLQQQLSKAGSYTIDTTSESAIENSQLPEKSFATYKPLILIVAFIVGVSLLAQYPFADFSWPQWMRHFMAGFFIVFAFFKLLNLSGFASAYTRYDLLAGVWKGWGYVYPFVELGLGLLYLTNFTPYWTNLATVIILGISSIGVIISNLKKQKIKCACLGDVFKLPMSTVTIIEDLAMVAMAGLMLTM